MRKTLEFEDCFAELISLPSVSSMDPQQDQSNRPVIDVLANNLEALGFMIEIMPIHDQPEKCNLIATRKGQPSQTDEMNGSGLVLSGHTDTVSYDSNSWNTDPLKLTKLDGHYYGLGTADMKSFFPIVLETLERLETIKFNKPITVIATADEESTMAGARALQSANRPFGDYCIIGEPTGLVPRHQHKGIIIETISVTGSSGHSSDPDFGHNALEGMNDIMNALRKWRDELQQQYKNTDFSYPMPTLNLGRIQGGTSANCICANCELSIDLRLLPEMALDDFRIRLHNTVNEAVAGSGLAVKFTSPFNGVPPMQTATESEIVKMSEKLTKTRTNSVSFCTEAPFFNSMGTETIILGPGDIDVAHQPNEYLQLARIEPMINILSKMINYFCGNA